MHLSFAAQNAFEQHVLREYPREACGVIVAGNYTPCRNVSTEPTTSFRIEGAEIARIEVEHGPIEAYLHSHPFQGQQESPPEWPTAHDLKSWMNQSKPWGIVATDGVGVTAPVWLDDGHPEPLEGRQFIFGVNDCYSLVRDWFRLERGIVLPNFVREPDWWVSGLDLYGDNFEAAGFVEIRREEVRVGDACLMQIRSPVLNHAAVITGPNQILHHLMHRLSGTDQFSKWERCVGKYLRYRGQP